MSLDERGEKTKRLHILLSVCDPHAWPIAIGGSLMGFQSSTARRFTEVAAAIRDAFSLPYSIAGYDRMGEIELPKKSTLLLFSLHLIVHVKLMYSDDFHGLPSPFYSSKTIFPCVIVFKISRIIIPPPPVKNDEIYCLYFYRFIFFFNFKYTCLLFNERNPFSFNFFIQF